MPTPSVDTGLLQTLRAHGPGWWRAWDAVALTQACAGLDAGQQQRWPELARWHGLASFMSEDAQALACLDLAWRGFTELGQGPDALLTARMALVFCLADSGAASQTSDWLARANSGCAAHEAAQEAGPQLWQFLGSVATVALGQADHPAAAAAAGWLDHQVHAQDTALSPDERLLCALLLLEYRFATQAFEQFWLLVSVVEVPALYLPASPLLRSRWTLMVGYTHHLTGHAQDAEADWRRAFALAQQHACHTVQLQATLALTRQMLDGGRLDEAQAALDAVRPQWGAGRASQLVHLQQQRARLLLLRGQPARALSLLQDALALAESAAWPEAEKSSCLVDLAQVHVALDQLDAAQALLVPLAAARQGRDALVLGCMNGLVQAWRLHLSAPEAARQALASALAAARQARMHMFFRQLPAMAAELCALALRWQIERPFVTEVIRTRKLPAPADADASWPWPHWLGLIGGFEWRRDGQAQRHTGKAQLKPLELLRLLACERSLSLGMAAAAQAMWPDAEGDAGMRNLDVAVHRLRKLLGEASLLWVHDNRLGLDSARITSDVRLRRKLIDRIEQLALQPAANPHGAAQAVDECRQGVARVMAMTAGELLPEAPATPWLESARLALRKDTVRAALAAANLLARGPTDEAERQLLEAALHVEPLAEALVGRLAQAYHRAGHQGDMLRVFETHRRHLAALGQQPGAQLLALRARLQAG